MGEPRAYRARHSWPTVVAGFLAVLGACSRSDEPSAPPTPTAAVQTHAAYAALASVQAAHGEKAPDVMPIPEQAAGALGPAPTITALNLYEVGAEGFFLERAEALGFSAAVIGELTTIKETAMTARLTSQHEIDVAEQHLRMLTSAAAPDPATIDGQLATIGRLGTHQRMTYVRAVGRAIAVLDDAQRSAIMTPGPPPPMRPM